MQYFCYKFDNSLINYFFQIREYIDNYIKIFFFWGGGVCMI